MLLPLVNGSEVFTPGTNKGETTLCNYILYFAVAQKFYAGGVSCAGAA